MKKIVSLISVIIGYLCSASFVSALVVTTVTDSGLGSLRQAIADAAPGDTLTFASELSGQTILLTSGQLLVSKDLDINASSLADGLTIDGNANGRIFTFGPATINTLEGLTLTNGFASGVGGFVNGFGGCVYIGSDSVTLTLNECVIVDNSARIGGGVFNFGTLTLNRSTICR